MVKKKQSKKRTTKKAIRLAGLVVQSLVWPCCFLRGDDKVEPTTTGRREQEEEESVRLFPSLLPPSLVEHAFNIISTVLLSGCLSQVTRSLAGLAFYEAGMRLPLDTFLLFFLAVPFFVGNPIN